MDDFEFDSFADFQQRLKSSAGATRPEFSPVLHERILAAIDDCEMLPLHPWSARLRQPLAIAASVLALVTGGVLAGNSLTSMFRQPAHSPASSAVAAPNGEDPPGGALAAHDAEWMQRALAAADHWGWLDDDTRSAAAWFVADVQLDADLPDVAVPEEEVEPAQGS